MPYPNKFNVINRPTAMQKFNFYYAMRKQSLNCYLWTNDCLLANIEMDLVLITKLCYVWERYVFFPVTMENLILRNFVFLLKICLFLRWRVVLFSVTREKLFSYHYIVAFLWHRVVKSWKRVLILTVVWINIGSNVL